MTNKVCSSASRGHKNENNIGHVSCSHLAADDNSGVERRGGGGDPPPGDTM